MIILLPTITMNLERLDFSTDISLDETNPDRVTVYYHILYCKYINYKNIGIYLLGLPGFPT